VSDIVVVVTAPESDVREVGSGGYAGTSGVYLTPEGGIAVRYVNGTGAPSVKGSVVRITGERTVNLSQVGVPDSIGVVYQDGIAAGADVWVVISGIAEVLFTGNTTAGHLARTFIAADSGGEAGKALSEAVPSSPFATDKHFCEIGHVVGSRVGAGLAKVNLHFN
jgi:hypothetical protein